MADGKQTTIGVSRERYAQLAKKKRALEGAVDQHFSWGTFLSILAGLQPIMSLIVKTRTNLRGFPVGLARKRLNRLPG